MEQKSLTELIIELMPLRKKMDALPTTPKKPIRKNAYTISEWNEYAAEVNRIDEIEKNRKGELYRLDLLIKDIEKQIYKILPQPHVWIITDDKKYAIGIQHSNWGGGTSTIVIRENPDIEQLGELKEIYYN